MDGAREGLGTCEVMNLPLLIPRGDHRHLSGTQESHNVRDTVRDESSLATALDVWAIESGPADSVLLHEDERTPESFAEICKRVKIQAKGYNQQGVINMGLGLSP